MQGQITKVGGMLSNNVNPDQGMLDIGWDPTGSALGGLVVFALSAIVALVAHKILFWVLERVVRRTEAVWDDRIPAHMKAPARLAFVVFAFQFARPALGLGGAAGALLEHALAILAIVASTWFLVRLAYLARDVLLLRFDVAVSDNLRSRKIQTQVRILQNVLIAVVVVISTAMVLMTFDGVRQIGMSLLASAGIAGVILGFAAQKTIGNLFAGIQLALTQPIRIDDVVIVEGEWGWIEEITLTYVVVKIWDLRRLIVPISYFIERPIQNWTRSASQIMGTLTIACDHSTDVAVVRGEVERLVRQSPLWDGAAWGVQVVESKAEVIEVRILASAADSGKAWDLRCHLREAVLDFLRREHPEWLPLRRISLDRAPGGAS